MSCGCQPHCSVKQGSGFEEGDSCFFLMLHNNDNTSCQENNLTDLGELEKVCDAAVQKFNDLADQSKAASARMKDISELQKHIGAYGKTREIYAQYRKLAGRKREKFYEQHSSEITACQAAKRYFNSLGLKKLPSMQSLKQEYAVLQAEKKKRYPEYRQAKEKMIELLTAKNNVERILGVTEKEKNRNRRQGAQRRGGRRAGGLKELAQVGRRVRKCGDSGCDCGKKGRILSLT